MMPIKLDDEQCRAVLRDDPELVYAQHAGKLAAELASCNETRDMYRIQGAIALLNEVRNLKQKARKQIDKD